MYRIAICDDKIEDLEQMNELVRQIMPTFDLAYEVNRFLSIQQLLEAFDSVPYQLILLDILFEGPEGLIWAKEVQRRGYDCSVILVSSSTDYLLAGYDIHAIHYIVKPPDRNKLQSAIRYALLHGPRPDEKITLQASGSVQVLEQQRIFYLESINHDVLVHAEGCKEIKCRGKLEDFEQRLSGIAAARCHRSYLVNLARVRAIRYDCVELSGGKKLPMSRTYKEPFKKAYLDYKITV